jgi:hypothetical protein
MGWKKELNTEFNFMIPEWFGDKLLNLGIRFSIKKKGFENNISHQESP